MNNNIKTSVATKNKNTKVREKHARRSHKNSKRNGKIRNKRKKFVKKKDILPSAPDLPKQAVQHSEVIAIEEKPPQVPKNKQKRKDRKSRIGPGKPAGLKTSLGVVNIKEYCTAGCKGMLSTMFAHKRFNFSQNKSVHPHRCCAFARTWGRKIGIDYLNKESSTLQVNGGQDQLPILDVGLSIALAGRKNIHSCECGTDGYTMMKLQNVARSHPNAELIGPVTRSGDAWTFCRCNAKVCKHTQYMSALFVHSIYYNTPAEVAEIIHNSVGKMGFSVHHTFPEQSGEYYKYDEDCELKYRVSFEKDEVYCHVRGNSRDAYVHPTGRWMNTLLQYTYKRCDICNGPCSQMTSFFHSNSIKTWTLVWKTVIIENTNQTTGVYFTLLPDCGGEDERKKPPDCYNVYKNPQNKMDEEVNKYMRIKAKKESFYKNTWFGKNHYGLDYGTQVVKIPKQVLAKAYKFQLGKDINEKNRRSLVADITRNMTSKELGVATETINMLHCTEAIANIVTEWCISQKRAEDHFITHKKIYEIRQYNKSFDITKTRMSKQWLVSVCVSLILFSALLLVPLIPWAQVMKIFPEAWQTGIPQKIIPWVAILIFLILFSRATMIVFNWSKIPYLVFFTLFGTAKADNGLEHCSPYLWIALLILLLLVLVLRWLKRRIKLDPYHDWREYKATVSRTRESYPINCRVPELDGFKEFDSRIDLKHYPMSPKAVFKIKSLVPRKDKKIGSYLVGVCFDTAMPVLFQANQHNAEIGIKSRSLLEVPEADPLRWDLLDKLMVSETTGIYSNYATSWRPRCDICYEWNGRTVKQPESFTYEMYRARFPKPKRLKMDMIKDRISRREVGPKDFTWPCFLKKEKIMQITKDVYEPLRPRVIHGEPPVCKVIAGPWMLDYSYALKTRWGPRNWIWYCSGYTSEDFSVRMTETINKLGGLGNVLFIGTDFSKYEITQGEECLSREHKWYKKLNLSRFLMVYSYTFYKLYFRCRERAKEYLLSIMFSIWWTRKSGASDTSSGNSKNTGDCIAGFFKWLGVKGSTRLDVLGDDNSTVTNIRRLELALLKKKKTLVDLIPMLTDWCTGLGYKVKIIVTRKIVETEFLSLRFYPVGDRFIVGKKPGRCLVKIGHMMAKLGYDGGKMKALFKGVLISYRATSYHVPFLRIYIKAILNKLRDIDADFSSVSEYDLKGPDIYDPTPETYAAFESFYGIGFHEELQFQRDLEEHLNVYGFPSIMNSHYVDILYAKDHSI